MGVAFESIKQDLRKKILGKTWLAGIKMPSSRELAAIYNCSTNTIEKSLKDLQSEGLLVREARRGTFVAERVFSAEGRTIPRLTETVAVVVDSVNSYIFSKAFRGIEDVLKMKGFGLTISSHDNDPERQETILKELIQQGIKGIILYPALAFENDSRTYRNLEALLDQVSIVCMDRYIYNAHLSIPYVTSDNFYASYQMTRQLIENGHRKIGFVRNYNVSTVIERLMGYKQALHDFGIPYREDMDILLHVRNEDVPSFSTEWLAPRIESLKLTAFFTTNYNLAGHVMNGLGKIGLSIPKDISLVSYEVEYMNSFMPLKIAGVTQRFYEMGKAAAAIIVGLVRNTHESDMTGYVCHSIFHPGESIRKLG